MQQAGDLSLSRDAANGLLTGTELGPVSTSLDYDGFDDLESLAARRGGTDLFEESVDRDAGGRITSKTDTIAGETHTFEYGYDAAGRLETVRRSCWPGHTRSASSTAAARRLTNGSNVTRWPARRPVRRASS